MRKNQKTDESGNIIDFFNQFLPGEALSNEKTTTISGDFLRLRYETAQSLKTNDPTLAKDELARFLENCKITAAVSLGIELRNYLLYEIYSKEQYRQTDQDFVTFGMRMTELKKAQLMRAVHAGRIRVAMIFAELDDVRPTGRQVESLSKIEDAQHTVQAWLYALDFMKIHGKSDATAREGLMEYCKIKKIRYGRRAPNGSRKLPIQKALGNRKDILANTASEDELSIKEDWKLTPHEQQLILGIDPETDMSISGPELQKRISKHVDAFQNLAAKNQSSDYETRQLEELLALIMRKDKSVARSLAKLALQALREAMLEEINGDKCTDNV
jgi:hypothetical protein